MFQSPIHHTAKEVKHTRMKVSPCTQVIVMVLTLGLLCEVHAQNYHFSNGWQPGKRSYRGCTVRPEIRSILFKIIEDEVERIQKCSHSNIEDVFSLIQEKTGVDAREV
uniref:Uncharacterized protein n=1 Tax=Magallana gigas TaxID=29159 RepID=A0A8W8IKY6_MAGGI